MANENTRIYLVNEAANGAEPIRHLVRAANASQAIRHIATPRYTADVASQDDLVELAGAGIKVQNAATA